MHAGPATGTAPLIDVDLRLTVRDATRGFDLAVRFASDDPVLALYGASGAGKSLTLQAIAGLLQPCAGHVRIAGRTLYDSAAGIALPAEDRRIGVLFQDYALFPHLDVRQNVAFGLTRWHRRRLSRADALRVDGLLSAFGLESLSKARPAARSGGQRQRVALARALACEPSLLLLDEPFAALNPQWRQELRQELAAVRARWHIPMLMVTHDVDDVLALADRACLIDRGQVVREVDLRSGAPVEHLWRELVPARARPAADGPALALRRLLGAPPRTA